jgi:hypothetical protein
VQFFVTKTGLDAFDTARAWGLAVLLNVLTQDEVRLQDASWAFILEPKGCIPQNAQLTGLVSWGALFAAGDVQDVQWDDVFVTQRGRRGAKKGQVRQILETQLHSLLSDLQRPDNLVEIGSGENVPGGLEPAAFKGLRHVTKASYREDQLKVSEGHWALSCLGMATCGTYRRIREAGQYRWLVLLPVPQNVHFNYFRDVQQLMRPCGLRLRYIRYIGVQNAAAHYAVQLAEQLRRRAAAQGSLQDRFSGVLYFTLFGTGQQVKPSQRKPSQVKPSQGSQLNLTPLMDAIQEDPHGTEAMLKWLDYCFRLGATKGAEELALAVTELVMRWDLDAYEKLVKVFVRFIARNQIRYDNLPYERTLLEVMKNVKV